MKTSDDPARTRRRLIALIAAGIVLLVLTGIGVYGLLTGPAEPATSGPDDRTVQVPAGPGDPTPRLPRIAPTDDPEEFARSAALALFTWDTTSGLFPLDYASVLLDVGDPTGTEQAGLASDIAAYLPSREAWLDLRQYQTSQHLSIDDAFVPGQWAEAVEQARPGQLPVGATAITIEGTRHRTGVWNDETVASEHAVAFTIFLACPPELDDEPSDDGDGETSPPETGGGAASCYLLRLSMLDSPLR
ncbi:hypothetical protein brsh051_11300 [Brooklawnia propionicigenes]|uniref:Uncharacterized protein n=1 Tax=Brooklawnia propionicigenes TaxID=3041175 RepID=A0AAN0KDF0_9ACTN|nr:hypothetical protein [Brooklawnia sp. SH051]BEH01849.1 hypothetical protein brsh051_11300 [Brooklawnia sp. SH051]